jgi:Undecaprenyl-phosphate galactose phosphotransferase WbaP
MASVDVVKPPVGGAALHLKLLLLAGDVCAMLLAFFSGRLGNWLVKGMSLEEAFLGWWDPLGEIRLLLYLGSITVMVFGFWGLGHYSRRRPFWDDLRQILVVLMAVAVVDGAIAFLGKWYFSRLWVLSTWVLALLFVPFFRIQLKRLLVRSGQWRRATVILGVGDNAREAAAALQSEPLMGFDVTAFLVPPGDAGPAGGQVELADRRVPALSLDTEPLSTLQALDWPCLVVALESDAPHEHQKLVQRLSMSYPDLNVIPSIRGLPLLGMESTHFFSHEVLMLRVRNNLARLGPRLVKRGFDIVVAGVLMILLAPLFVLIAWSIWREDGLPVIFAQKRLGLDGVPFEFYKFRTMVRHADDVLEQWKKEAPERYAEYLANNFKLKHDPRVLRVGRWLRGTSLDELPQLWNVIKGNMSLVGPRPLLEREVGQYGESLPFYIQARPGISGLWQISGRSETTFTDRANLDAWYVRNWSLWYDVVILVKTVKVVLRRQGAY